MTTATAALRGICGLAAGDPAVRVRGEDPVPPSIFRIGRGVGIGGGGVMAAAHG